MFRVPIVWLLSAGLAAGTGAAAGPTAAAEFVAPYVGSTQEDVELMLELAELGPGDYLIDLGSGDGRIVIGAALRGALAHGVELDRELVDLARQRARAAEVDDRVAFEHGDVFEADVSGASVVTLYLMPEANLRLRPRLLAALEPGSRVVSNSFDMGEWRPDRHEHARASGGIMLWIVPARVAGRWSLTAPGASFTLDIEQRFQELSLSLTAPGGSLHVLETALAGDRIAFAAGDGRRRFAFSGRVDGRRMQGMLQIHDAAGTRLQRWRAQRVAGAANGAGGSAAAQPAP